MTGPTQHPAPNSDARKRMEAKSAPHHDPAVCELIARAWDEGFDRAESMARCWGHTDHWGEENPYPTNPYRSAS